MKNSFTLREKLDYEQVKEILQEELRGGDVTLLPVSDFGTVQLEGKYYIYTLQINNYDVKVKAKWKTVWLLVQIAMVILSFFLLFPFLVAIYISFTGNGEYKRLVTNLNMILNNPHKGTTSSSNGNGNAVEQLEKLASLKEKNMISDYEYESKKEALLKQIQ